MLYIYTACCSCRIDSGVASRGRVPPQRPGNGVRHGEIKGGHRPLPGPDRGECRGRPKPVAGSSVRVPVRRGRGSGGDGPDVLVLAHVHVGDRVGWRRTTGFVVCGFEMYEDHSSAAGFLPAAIHVKVRIAWPLRRTLVRVEVPLQTSVRTAAVVTRGRVLL